jgi:DUF2075 family protein
MRLYAGTTTQLHEDTVRNQIAGKLADAYFHHFRRKPAPSEVASWQNSLRALSMTFQQARLDDHGVLLEYQLPMTSKRLDCLVCGKETGGRDEAVIVELKQWDECGEAWGDDLVVTRLGGAEREVLHPSAQVSRYRRYLEDGHTAFYEGPQPVRLSSCAYLHNYTPHSAEVLFLPRYDQPRRDSPIFTADDLDAFCAFLQRRLERGEGLGVLRRIEQGRYRPSKKLMQHVGKVIKGEPQYILLDEQQVVYSKVFACARSSFHSRRKAALIVRGGPGTGKSVIAINLMSELLLAGYNAHYATGSRAFTKTLRRVIGPRGEVQFRYFNDYGAAQFNEVDVLICDEAHRIRKTSASRFTPKAQQTGFPQVRELLAAAKVCVFFIDDQQVVRPDEIGSTAYLREQASALGCQVFEMELEAQFRCAGSEAFVSWIDNTLGIDRTPDVLWQPVEAFELRIFDSPETLEGAIRDRADQGFSARLAAGFCWPWSAPNADGTLVPDVAIGGFHRPWNAKSDSGRLAKGIPPESLWAYEPGGLDQIGCIYTAQGFEFDYIGVIVGNDLVYRFDEQAWVGQPSESRDAAVKRAKDRFVDLAKNAYRVLLSRGLKGCYVHFLDQETERFFRSRIEGTARSPGGSLR